MTHGSLFSGIGGFDLAAQWAGITNIWQVEKDQFCQKILKKNFPEGELYGDIREVGKHNLKRVDIISGGFPCQPFSFAGKRRGKEDDRYLWNEMLRVIQEIKPSWIIGENVAGIVNMALDEVLFTLENEGYETQSFIIPAVSVNAPHRRDRVWIVAHAESCNDRRKAREFYKKNGRQDGKMFPKFSSASKTIPNTTSKRLEWQDWCESKKPKFTRFSGWETEPDVGRVVDGFPGRVDRLRALGNAIVPQVAFEIFKAIKQISNG